MAKAKAAKKSSAKSLAVLSKPKKGDKSYTKSKLISHLAAAVTQKGVGDVSKKQAAAFLEELTTLLFNFAPVGAALPGIGKMLVREIPAKPARTIMSFGKEINVKAKPKSQKVVFRFSMDAKDYFRK